MTEETPVQRDDTEAVLAGILQRYIKARPAKITREQRFQADLGIDSLAMIDVAVAAEDAFGVRIPDEDLERLATVGDAVDYIQRAKDLGPPL
jgi:acyl carrier protein